MKKFLLIIVACTLTGIQLMAQHRAQVIAHRGYWQSRGAAQNSIASLENAEKIRVYGSEFDVHLTADNVAVIYHDGEVNGVSIQQSPYSAIKDMTLSNGEKPPTLREYLEAARRTEHIRLILELKPHATPERNREAVQTVIELVREKKLMHRTDFITFNLDAGKEFIRLAPESEVYYLNGELSPQELKKLGFAGLDYNLKVMQNHPDWFKEAKKLGLGVNIWTVNDTSLIREMVEQGADFITTDVPNDALRFLGNER